MIQKPAMLISIALAGFMLTSTSTAQQFAPYGYLEQPTTQGGYGYSNNNGSNYGGYVPTQPQMPAQPQIPAQPQMPMNHGGYGQYPGYAPSYNGGNYQQPQYPPMGYGPQLYSQQPRANYGYNNRNYANPGYAPNQNQWRRPPQRQAQSEPFSMIPWDHLPGGEMPDFNPFSQGPFKRLPSKMFDTQGKDWAVQQFGDVWEDALNAPHNMGRMPGNVQAPSVSIPNPIDLGDQIGASSATITEEAPEVVQGWFD